MIAPSILAPLHAEFKFNDLQITIEEGSSSLRLKRDFGKHRTYKAIGDIACYVILASGMSTFIYHVSLLRNKTLMIVRL